MKYLAAYCCFSAAIYLLYAAFKAPMHRARWGRLLLMAAATGPITLISALYMLLGVVEFVTGVLMALLDTLPRPHGSWAFHAEE